ncbi:MAG TPA: hypothetical protein VFQ61_07080 [Polyangiaceae bacterium]|nr:hypothetical protein [Polyangiaceae bacterium]
MRSLHSFGACALALFFVSLPGSAWALDKQGKPHVFGAEEPDLNLAGALSFGPALFNPAYAARPDNTGKALMRYALHLDLELLGPRLTLPVDINTFTDRDRSGFKKLSPTELDLIAGVASTWPVGPGSLELSSHAEQDRALDRHVPIQTYVDVRSRYLCSASSIWTQRTRNPLRPDFSAAMTIGWFAYNPSYFARPDNTGRALLRYNPHLEFSLYDGALAVGLDATFFTDRKSSALLPSELDLTPELRGQFDRYELHLAYERDMPVDRAGLVQHFAYALAVVNFDFAEDLGGPRPPRERHN